MKTISITLTVLAVLVGVEGAQAQPDSLWSRTFGGAGSDACFSLIQTVDEGYVLSGVTNSFGEGDYIYLVKTDAEGSQQWQHTYGGGTERKNNSVRQTADGGYILVGSTDSFGAGSADIYLVKTDAEGNQQWQRTFGGAETERASSVQQTTDGGYILAGRTSSFGADELLYLVKTDADGNLQWQRTFAGGNDSKGYHVRQTADGGYVIAGGTSSFGAGSTDFWLVKTDTEGNQQWQNTFGGGAFDWAHSIQQTADGGYVLAGETQSFGAGKEDVWLVWTNGDGDSLWSRTFGGDSTDMGGSIIQTDDGGFTIAGITSSFSAGNTDMWLVRTDVNGDSLWSRTFGGDSTDVCSSLLQATDGSFALAGFTNSFGAGDVDFWLVKTGPDPLAVSEPIAHPLLFALDSPFPNPFNSQIQITYSLPEASLLSIRVFDIAGREVATLISGNLQAGNHTAVWNAEGFNSGVYLVKMETSGFSSTKKVTLVK